jgi:hypothetical protein
MVYSNNFNQVRVGIRNTVVTQVVNAVDADATAFIAAAGITDLTQAAAISTLVNDLKTYGLWTKMKALYPMVGGTATSHKFNLKDPRDLDAAYRLTFFGGLTHDSNGVLGNGTNAYAYTNLRDTDFSLNNMTAGWYNMNNVANTVQARYAIGSSYTRIQFRYFDSFDGQIQRIGGSVNTFANSATQKGMYVLSRQNSTQALAYKNGTLQNTAAQTGVTTSLTGRIIILFATDNGQGTATAPSVTGYGPWHGNCIYFADGMNSTEVSNIYTSIQKFNTTLGRQSGTPYVSDADAVSFLTAAGITDVNQALAINTLVTDLKAAGIWTKMKALYPFVGGNAASHKFNLKDPRDLDAAYRLVFNGGWTHASTGALPNGTTGYADTKLIPSSVMTNYNSHMSFYSRTQSLNSGVDIGSCHHNYFLQVYTAGFGGGTRSSLQRNDYDFAFYQSSSTIGHFMGQILSQSNSKIYTNGVLRNTNTTNNAISLPSINIYIGSLNINGVAGNFTNRESVFASIGDGLTDNEASAFYTAVQKYQTSLGRQVNTPLVSDSDAQSFLNVAGITSYTQANAVNTLVVDLKAAGVWTKMKALYPFVGGYATSHKFNLKDPRDVDAAYRLVFNGGWTHTSTGALPNGTTGYADTKIKPNDMAQNSAHMSTYLRTYNESGIDMGSNTINRFWISANVGAGVRPLGLLNVVPFAVTGPNLDTKAFLLASRTDSTTNKLFRNSSLIYNETAASSTPDVYNIYLGAVNVNNGGSQYSYREQAFSSIGDGLTDDEATSFYTAVQKFNTSLGRQVGTPVYNTNGLVLNLDVGNANSYPGTGTTWFDLASGNNGTMFSGITYDVNNGGGLIFNGSNQYISSFNNTNLNFTSSDKFTISCFFKATSTSSYLGLVVSGNTSGEWNYGLWVTNGKLQAGTHNNNRVGNSTIVTGQIYQATLTYSNNTMKVYLNGLNDGTFTSISLFSGLNQQLTIGRKGARAENYFPGTVYNVQIYNRELSETEVLQNFNNTRGRFGL